MIFPLSRRITGVIFILTLACGCQQSPTFKESAFLKRGLALQAHHDYARAILEFRNASQAMPSDPEPEYRLGIAYLLSGRPDGAIVALRRAVEINPQYAPAQIKLADLMLNTHDPDLVRQAAVQLRALLDSAPDDSTVAGRLAVADWSLGRVDDAEKLLQQSLDKFPTDLRSSVALARLKLSRNDLKGALAVLERSAQNSPRSVPAAIALSQVYAKAGRGADAERELRRALDLDPRNGMALLGLAMLLFANQRSGDAETALRKLADLSDPAYRGIYGDFLFQTGKRDAALAEFERQLRIAPDDRAARSRLITAYVQMNRVPEAKALLGRALEKNPKDTDALWQLSIMALEAGNIDEAETDLHQVIGFIPNSAEAHFALAAVFKARGLLHNERQELTESLRLNPRLLPARLWLVQSFLIAQENQSALNVVDQAPVEQRQVLALVVERNWALLFLGRSREVKAIVEQALRYGRFPELVLQDAVVKMKEGNYAGARAGAEEVLRQNPEEARAARIIIDSYVAQNQKGKAGERLAQIVAAHPGSAALERLAGSWFEALHQNAEAQQAFTVARTADPKSINDSLSLAALDLERGQTESARQEAQRALKFALKNVKALLLCAEVEKRSGHPGAAAGYYRDVLDLDENNLMALNNLAGYLTAEDPDEALKLAQRAMETAPDNPGVEDTLGWILYRKEMYQAALGYLKAAAGKAPNPRRRLHLGLTYLKLGDRDLGRQLVAAAIREDPNLTRGDKP